MTFTLRQEKCLHILMYHLDKGLDELMQFDDYDDWLKKLDERLDQTATVVDTLSASAALGVALAPVTGGASLAVSGVLVTAAAGITIGKAVNGCVRALSSVLTDTPEIPENEMALAAFKLSIRVGYQQIADAIVVYYSHIINEVMEESSIPIFARYGAMRVLKKFKIELKSQLEKNKDSKDVFKIVLSPEVFIDYLLQSTTLSAHSEKIMIHPKYLAANWMGSREMPVKWAYSRSRFVLATNTFPVNLGFYSSQQEGHFTSGSTLACYGYVMPQLFCELTLTIQINQRYLQQVSSLTGDLSVRNNLTLFYPVTRRIICEYLEANRLSPQSLNHYLSECCGIRVIAVIRGDVLSDLDLKGADFSHVIGHYVKIVNSNLCDTQWSRARLPYSFIANVAMNENTSFDGVFLEFSELYDLHIIGNWSNMRLQFVTMTRCIISTLMLDKLTSWDWVIMHDVTMEDHVEKIAAASRAAVLEMKSDIEAKVAEETRELEVLFQQKLQQMRQSVVLIDEHQRIADTELLVWSDQQLKNQAEQAQINREMFERLRQLETLPERHLKYKIEEHFQVLYKSVIAQPHIELFVKSMDVAKSTMRKNIVSLLENESSFSVAIVAGPLGCGKSTDISSALVSLKMDVNEERASMSTGFDSIENDWVMEVLPLWKIKDLSEGDLLFSSLRKQGYTAEEFLLLKQRPCLFVLDGYEDCQVNMSQNLVIDEIYHRHSDWKKLVILMTVTSEFIAKNPLFYENMRYGRHSVFPNESKIHVLPFSKDQIDAYFQLYFPKQFSLKDSAFATKFPVKEIYHMAKSPIMAHIICEVFAGKAMGDIPQTPIQFCKAFMKLWYLNILAKASNSQIDLHESDIQEFIKTIAYEMFRQRKFYIDRPFEVGTGLFQQRLSQQQAALSPSMIALIFTDPACKKAGTLMPLSVDVVTSDTQVMLRYKFIHKFIHYFALAMMLIDILEHQDMEGCLAGWNCNYIQERDIYLFMEGFFNERCEVLPANKGLMLSKLREMVKRSATDHSQSCAASNAITLLNNLHYNFRRHLHKDEWQGIHIPYAYLKHAPLAGLNLSNGDYRYVQFQRAEIAGTNFSGSDTFGTRFLSDAERHHYIAGRPKAVARYKNSTMDIISYAIPQAPGEASHKIVNFGLDGKKYPSIDGHKSQVLCMEWGREGLISSSMRGTIYRWSEEGDKVQTYKYKERIPIYSLSWHPQGHYFASGGADGNLCIWDTRKFGSETCIKEIQEGGILRRVLFAKMQPFLLTAGDSAHLHIWNYTIQDSQLENLTLQSDMVFSSAIYCIDLSPDETYVAVGLKNGGINVRKIVASAEGLAVENFYATDYVGSRYAINSLIWHHKNSEVLISGGDDGAIRTWDTKTGECKIVQYGDGMPIEQLCLLIDGKRILAGQDRMLSIWEIEPSTSKSSVREVHVENRIQSMVSFEDKLITGHIDGSVIEWGIEDASQHMVHQHESGVYQIARSIDGQFLATLSNEHVILIHNRLSRGESQRLILGDVKIQQIGWIRDTRLTTHLIAATDAGLYVWSLEGDELLKVWRMNPLSSDSVLQCFASQHDGSQVAMASEHEIIISCYNHSDNHFAVLQHLELQHFPVTQLAWSLNDEWLASMDESHGVYLWNLRTGTSQLLDSELTEEKRMSWVVHNQKQCLMISSLDHVKLLDVSQSSIKKKKISSGAERVAVSDNIYFLADKLSVDIMRLEGDRLVYKARIGGGLCTRDTNLSHVTELKEDESRALEIHGATVTKPWLSFNFFNRERVDPLPSRMSPTDRSNQPSKQKSLAIRSMWSFHEDDSSSSLSSGDIVMTIVDITQNTLFGGSFESI